MKYALRLILAVAFLLAATTAVAGKGGPSVEGNWIGAGQAMYPDGTMVEIVYVGATLFQNGNFIYGFASFSVDFGGDDPVDQEGQMSGHIKGNAVTGLMGICWDEPPECGGSGVFEGKLSGNRLTGTVVDLNDGSTSYITLHRTSID